MAATLYRIDNERISPDDVLDRCKGDLETVVVLGRTMDGEHYLASSLTDPGQVLWLLEQCKLLLLDIDAAD